MEDEHKFHRLTYDTLTMQERLEEGLTNIELICIKCGKQVPYTRDYKIVKDRTYNIEGQKHQLYTFRWI